MVIRRKSFFWRLLTLVLLTSTCSIAHAGIRGDLVQITPFELTAFRNFPSLYRNWLSAEALFSGSSHMATAATVQYPFWGGVSLISRREAPFLSIAACLGKAHEDGSMTPSTRTLPELLGIGVLGFIQCNPVS